MKKLVTWLSALVLALGSLHLIHLRRVNRAVLLVSAAKVVAEVFAPVLAVTAAAYGLAGVLLRAPAAVAMALGGLVLSVRYVLQVTRARPLPPADPNTAFGPLAEETIPPDVRAGMLPRRWNWLAPAPPPAMHIRDLPFATAPLPPGCSEGDRAIYCDLWLPGPGVKRSGLGLIYLHGSAWYFGDKDTGTRPFFRYLAGQGHVAMDVAYRMCPETDYRGMVGDAKRAIAWMKEHGPEYGVDPNRVVISGGSAGGHLALLAAYTAEEEALRPDELAGRDLSVLGVLAYYGPPDFQQMEEYYQWQARVAAIETPLEGPIVPPGPGSSLQERQAFQRLQARRLYQLPQHLFGGYPHQVPDAYRMASPSTHVGSHCPPTLLIHGAHDVLVPISATRSLARRLHEAGVPVVFLELPATDHAFDLLFPRISPPSQAALYQVERFLALLLR